VRGGQVRVKYRKTIHSVTRRWKLRQKCDLSGPALVATLGLRLLKMPMGYFFEFDPVNKILRCCRSARVTDDLIFEVYSEAQKVLESRGPCRGIDDLSAVTEFAASSDTINKLADKSAFSVIELLVIVAPQAHLYGLSRMYSILTEATRRVQVVRTMEEAYSLLGVSSPQFSRISGSAASGQ
jgi:hypothetical protein